MKRKVRGESPLERIPDGASGMRGARRKMASESRTEPALRQGCGGFPAVTGERVSHTR